MVSLLWLVVCTFMCGVVIVSDHTDMRAENDRSCDVDVYIDVDCIGIDVVGEYGGDDVVRGIGSDIGDW